MPSDHSTHSYAAIDLGSNSFHMVVAEPDGDSIRVIDSLRAPVRLGAGLDENKRMLPATEQLALDTLAQFAQRLRSIPARQVRIVGTNTLRRARHTERFMRDSTALLGKPIEIISGREEARLIYQAVAHSLPAPDTRRLVADIGGGSTELICGTGLKAALLESVNMGCVSYSTRFFADKISYSRITRATTEAELELQPLAKAYCKHGWHEAYGCSGTIKSASLMLAESGITDGIITSNAIHRLLARIVDAGSVQAMNLTQVSNDRALVITGGLCILQAIMNTFGIERMDISQAALREGLIFEMIGHREHLDLQTQTLANLMSRYSIDTTQAGRVQHTAKHLFEHVCEPWSLDRESDLQRLCWAAQLHELGMAIAHTQYHKHGAYILEHSDMLGFSMAEQKALSLLVRFHRRKLEDEAVADLPEQDRDHLLKLICLLRLAALFHRGRHHVDIDAIELRVKEGQLMLKIPGTWLEAHPLTHAELLEEAERQMHVGIRLKTLKR